MVTVNFMYFFSCLELVSFYAADFVLAQALNRYKRDIPELDECGPDNTPDIDSTGMLRTAIAYQTTEAESSSRERIESVAAAMTRHPMHAAAVVCSLLGPLLAVVMTFFPYSASWMAQERPGWIRDIFVAVALAIVGLFTARTLAVKSLTDVSRSTWLSLMWFRLDFVLLMGAVAVVGFGAILVGLCMLVVGGYLAYRVLQLEKRLATLQSETQLLREDIMDDRKVLLPGSEESKRASGVAAEGYSKLV